ncbi:MAG: hypothetical protein ACREO9_11465, partial [Lysobacterales bacterium]
VIASLDSLGITVNWGDRLRMGLHDLAGMTGVFLPVIAAAFAIALPLVAWLSRRQSGWRTLLFTLAGAVALIAVHLSLEVTFDIIPIAGARSPLGLCAQGLAGAVGGYCFGALRQGTPR